jgi:hypothetical protein
MRGLGWWSLSVVAHALEPAERDVVLGDLAESGEGVGAAMRNLLGLIVRRQIGLWLFWRPWLALFGVSCLAGLSLSRIVFRFNVDLYKYGAGYATSLTAAQEVAFLLCLAGGLTVWSWTCGFVLGSLSGRAVWLTWSVFYFVVLDSAWARFVLAGNIILRDPHTHEGPLDSPQMALRLLMAAILPLRIAAPAFLFPALFGAFVGVRRRIMTVHHAYLTAAVNTALAILATWSTGWYDPAHLPARWPGVPWSTRLLPFLFASWPAAYLLGCTLFSGGRPNDQNPSPPMVSARSGQATH